MSAESGDRSGGMTKSEGGIVNKEVKEDEDPETRPYCTCRSSHCDVFMIMCEKCTEWFHGDCIKLEESFAKNINRYYCVECIQKSNGELQIIFKKKYLEKLENQKKEQEGMTGRCGDCIGCFRVKNKTEPCKACEHCQKGETSHCLHYRCVQPPPPKKKGLLVGRPRREVPPPPPPPPPPAPVAKSEDDEMISPNTSFRDDNAEKPKRGRKKGWRKVLTTTNQSVTTKQAKAEVDEEDLQAIESTIARDVARMSYDSYAPTRRRSQKSVVTAAPAIQCRGPNCVQESRQGSKYCSDMCGRALARERLKRFMPTVNNFWAMIPSAEVRAAELCKEKEATMRQINNRVTELLNFTDMLERYAASIKSAVPHDDDDDDAAENDFVACCTVCGLEYPIKLVHRHIERCFVKNEKQLSFGGNQTTESSQTRGLFCNEYNKVSDNYCKRLRVMCSEHYKAELEKEMEVCGCPKIWESTESLTFERVFVPPEKMMEKHFCMAPRKDCTIHNRWLQIAMGLIDTERMNVLLKLGEHSDYYQSLKAAIAARGDVLTMMCTKQAPFVAKH